MTVNLVGGNSNHVSSQEKRKRNSKQRADAVACSFYVWMQQYRFHRTAFRREALYFRVDVRLVSVRPSIRCPLTSVSHDAIFLHTVADFNGKNIHHLNRHCWKGFQSNRSKVKVTARRNALFWQRHSHQLTSVRRLSVRRRHTDGRCVEVR